MKIYKIDDGMIPLEDSAIALVREAGLELVSLPCHTSKDIVEKCRDASALVICIESIDRDLIAALPNLKAIARCGVGVDAVDLVAASEHGVQVTNVPDANLEEVAAHTMALALAMTRRIFAFDASTRRGEWTQRAAEFPMRRCANQVFGIAGGGRIGSRVAQIAMGLGFHALVHTLREDDRARFEAMGAEPVDFDELIRRSDVVSLHVPLTEASRNMISEDALARMKPGSCLINVSRGGLVDEPALVRALKAGHLGCAALDTFAVEPLPADSGLCGCPNLILTPHVAYLSEDSKREVSAKAIREAVAVLRGQVPKYPVNTIRQQLN